MVSLANNFYHKYFLKLRVTFNNCPKFQVIANFQHLFINILENIFLYILTIIRKKGASCGFDVLKGILTIFGIIAQLLFHSPIVVWSTPIGEVVVFIFYMVLTMDFFRHSFIS